MFDFDGWAAHAGMVPTGKRPGDVLAYSDMEIDFFVSEREDIHVVEKVSRGGRRQILGSFSSPTDALGFLVYLIGEALGGRSSPADYEFSDATLEEGPTATHLSWPDGSAQFSLGVAGPIDAAKFNWTRSRSLTEIARAFDPKWA